jgi:uncharacterized membrane protein
MSPASRLAGVAILLLLALQLAWYGWLSPPVHVPPWQMALAFALPILPAVVLVLLRHRRAAFWGAMAALLYFSHGVMEAWSNPAVRGLALAEVALSCLLVVAASWDGTRARFNKPRTPPAV